MIPWSEPGPAFHAPAGSLDIYQSIQRLEPGAWVAAHTHEGPESGVVLAGPIARHEAGMTRTFAAGATFCTPAGTVHATGNPSAHPVEAITLHVVRAGSPFSTPCACETAPPARPGSTNPARSIVRGIALAVTSMRARHARVALTAPDSLGPFPAIVTVRAGSVRAAGGPLVAPAFAWLMPAAELAPLGGPAELLLTRFEEAPT